MRWLLHLAVLLIGLVTISKTEVYSESPLEGAIYPLIAWLCFIYWVILLGFAIHKLMRSRNKPVDGGENDVALPGRDPHRERGNASHEAEADGDL